MYRTGTCPTRGRSYDWSDWHSGYLVHGLPLTIKIPLAYLSCFGTSHTANTFDLIGSVEGTEISVLHCQPCLGKLGDFNDRSPPYIVGKTKTDQIKPSEI